MDYFKRSMGDNSNSPWKLVYYPCVIVFCILSLLLLIETYKEAEVSFSASLAYRYTSFTLIFGSILLFHLLNSVFAVLYGVFSRKREGDFWEGAYNISVVVFCILSFAVLTFLVVAGFSQRFYHPLSFLYSSRDLGFPLIGQIAYSLIAAFAVLYPMLRLKRGLQFSCMAKALLKGTYYLGVAVFSLGSFISLLNSLTLLVVIFLFNGRGEIPVYEVLVLFILTFHFLNSFFVVFYGLIRRKHANEFWKRAYNFGVVAFFIMSLLAWLALFVLLFVLLIDSRLFGVPTSGLLSSVFTIYSLIASFVVIRGMIKLKSRHYKKSKKQNLRR